jgi:predicted SnoaL-like aldol condensation-catalyzing enzyme
MTAEANKELVRQWIEVAMPAAMRDPSRIDDLVTEYHHETLNTRTPHHHHHTETGLEGLKNEIRNAAASFRDVQAIVADEILGEGDLVAVHWTLLESPTSGEGVLRHVGQVDTGGKAMQLSGLMLFRVVDGKIAESWHYTNVIDVLVQHQILKLVPASA